MYPSKDQISSAAKTNFESGVALYTTLTSKTLESVEKLINLNLAATKASMEESSAITRQMLAASGPSEFMSLFMAQTRPNFEKMIAYSGHVSNIASSAQAEIGKAAEAQIAQASRTVTELMEAAGKNPSGGSDTFATLMRSTLGNATSNYEQFTKNAKQAVEAFGANMNTAASQVAQATEQMKS